MPASAVDVRRFVKRAAWTLVAVLVAYLTGLYVYEEFIYEQPNVFR